MASDPSADVSATALDGLEFVVRGLGDELAFFRRRALDAERRLRDVLAQHGTANAGARTVEADRARLQALEAENAELRARIAEAAERARTVAARMRFARQQDEAAAADGLT